MQRDAQIFVEEMSEPQSKAWASFLYHTASNASLCNLFLTSQAPLNKTTVTFPQSSQNFAADKATYTSRGRETFQKFWELTYGNCQIPGCLLIEPSQ